MSVIQKFLAKKKEYVVGGETIELKPLKMKQLDLILGVGNPDGTPNPEKVTEFIMAVLKNSYPGEPVDDMDALHFDELLEACLDVHGFNGNEVPKELKEKYPNSKSPQ